MRATGGLTFGSASIGSRSIGNTTVQTAVRRGRGMERRAFISALVGSLCAFGVLLAPTAVLAANPVTYAATDQSPDVAGAPDNTGVLVSDSPPGQIPFP